MIRIDLRRVLIFGVQFVLLFAVLLFVYAKTLPYYQRAAQGLANTIAESLDPPLRMENDPRGNWRAYVTSEGFKRVYMRWDPHIPDLVYLNLVLLPALLLATPAPIARRLKLLAYGMIPLYFLHVLSVIIILRCNYTLLFLDPGNMLLRVLLKVAYVSGQVYAVLLWILLTWRYWLLRPRNHHNF